LSIVSSLNTAFLHAVFSASRRVFPIPLSKNFARKSQNNFTKDRSDNTDRQGATKLALSESNGERAAGTFLTEGNEDDEALLGLDKKEPLSPLLPSV
jgi:hypothetical protein